MVVKSKKELARLLADPFDRQVYKIGWSLRQNMVGQWTITHRGDKDILVPYHLIAQMIASGNLVETYPGNPGSYRLFRMAPKTSTASSI